MAEDSLKPGFVRDYVSGVAVKASPEEIEAVQVFAQRLVEDYGYPKAHLQTRPQYRVRKRPSDETKAYPVDIAVFTGSGRAEDDLYLVVECKKKNRKDGVAQLKLYLDMSPTELGVWFNGDEHVYLRKIHKRSGAREYQELPNIPRYGQHIEDIGLFKRKDLVPPSNLKAVFRDLRNHLAGITTGITRDETLAQEIINLLFCKILDEQETAPEDMVTFRAGVDEDAKDVKKRILGIFEKVKTAVYDDVFTKADTITLDAESVRYVVGELQKIGLNARVRTLEWGIFLSNLTAHKLFHMHLQGWGPATLDADDLYSTNLYSKAAFSQFHDERLDRLVEQGRSTMDKEKRLQIYREIARFQSEEATHLFLWQGMNLYGVAKRVTWTPRPDEYLKMYDASVR